MFFLWTIRRVRNTDIVNKSQGRDVARDFLMSTSDITYIVSDFRDEVVA